MTVSKLNKKQNEERQIKALKKYEIDKWFIEKISGKDMQRPQLIDMLDFAREGDSIYIHDLSRLARSTADLLKIVDMLNRKKMIVNDADIFNKLNSNKDVKNR